MTNESCTAHWRSVNGMVEAGIIQRAQRGEEIAFRALFQAHTVPDLRPIPPAPRWLFRDSHTACQMSKDDIKSHG